MIHSQLSSSTLPTPKRVALGLSGGVDSSVCAALLLDQGYDVTGIFLDCWSGPGCRADQDRKDALDIAIQLGIAFHVLDFKQAYKEKVVEYFYREYQAGRTPNPDTMCNREIKFGLFYDWALGPVRRAHGKQTKGFRPQFDYIATGHYARVIHSQVNKTTGSSDNKTKSDSNPIIESSNYLLQRGSDPKKDQSYFLYQLRPEQLAQILFPIGHLTKDQVRDEAQKRSLKTATKPDSQGICFIGQVDVREFLNQRIEEKEGDVVIQGRSHQSISKRLDNASLDPSSSLRYAQDDSLIVIGSHDGVPFHTIGQKVGKEIDQALVAQLCKQGVLDFDPSHMPPLFVIAKDIDNNRLIVGPEEETYGSEFEVREVNWITGYLDNSTKSDSDPLIKLSDYPNLYVRIRHGGEMIPAALKIEKGTLKVSLAWPTKGIASGQACVFYSDAAANAVVLGGGIII